MLDHRNRIQEDVVADPGTSSVAERRNSKRGLITVGIVGIGALVGSVLFAVKFSNDSKEAQGVGNNNHPTAVAPGPEATSTSTESTTTTTAYSPETDRTTGTLHTARILPTDSVITATRANGDVIKVPRLRSTNNPNLFAESAMALMACYYTTGNQQCLDAFSMDPDTRKILETERTELIADRKNAENPDTLQFSIFDDPANPATFAYGYDSRAGQNYVEFTGGRMFMVSWATHNLGEAERWQGPVSHQMDLTPYNYVFDRFRVWTEGTADAPQIVGIDYHASSRH